MTYDPREREALINRVIGIIDRHDPYSLRASGAPENEFEPQARRIVDARDRCMDEQSCLDVIWTVFTDSFGESAGPKEAFIPMATDIWGIVHSPASQGNR